MVQYKTYIETGNTFDEGIIREIDLTTDIDGDRHNITIICDKGGMNIQFIFENLDSYGDILPVFVNEQLSFAKVKKLQLTSTSKDTQYRIIGGIASGIL